MTAHAYRPSRVVAIDPGVSGAIAIFQADQLLAVFDMPTTTIAGWTPRIPDGDHFGWQTELGWQTQHADAVVIEVPQPRPGNGMRAVAASMASWGVLLGACAHLPIRLVRPQVWTKALEVGADKDVHREKARALFGGTWFDRKKDDGRADAALIGWWWITHGSLEVDA